MPKKVYIETTIPSFYYNQRTAPEMVARMNWTREWWDESRQQYELFTSAAVIEELEAREHPLKIEKIALMERIPRLPITRQVLETAEVYVARKVMPADVAGDAVHLAFASVYACEVLLTWNCAHLANFNKFSHIRAVNLELGLYVPALLTPLQLLPKVE